METSTAREASAANASPCSTAKKKSAGPLTIGKPVRSPPIFAPHRRAARLTDSTSSGTSVSFSASSARSSRQRIGTELELHDLARGPLPAFHVERRPRRHGGPQALALPPDARVVDAAVHPLGVEAERIRDAKVDELPVHEREQRLVPVPGGERNIWAEPERVELIHPRVVARLRAARLLHVGELRARERVERPALGTVLARRVRPVQRALALATIEAPHVAAGQRRPHDAVAIDVHAARAIAGKRRLV